jgi:pimeloyl-ACP methyl ester carboxylesterase
LFPYNICLYLLTKLNKMFQNKLPITKSGKANTNGIELYYEVFGEETNPAILLIMGLDAQCLLWSETFIEPLLSAGYQVVRFDNRDIGHSTWLNNWKKSQPYTLEDMAKDTIGLLDYLGIEKAHFIGASMGGMIAQRLAISHSERVLTITSIMSSGHTLDPQTIESFYQRNFIKILPKIIKWLPVKINHIKQKSSVANYLTLYKFLAGTKYEFDKEYFSGLFTHVIEERKGQNPRARFQQFCAIVASGSRLHELQNIEVPTLILHGTADKLVPIAHAKKYAPLIKGSVFIELDGVGHEIPKAALPEVHAHLLAHLNGNK